MKYESTVYLEEIQKLANGLTERGIRSITHRLYDGFQVVVFDNNDKQVWDAICHSGSYGHEDGLLEVLGTISKYKNDSEGYLTAEDILARL